MLAREKMGPAKYDRRRRRRRTAQLYSRAADAAGRLLRRVGSYNAAINGYCGVYYAHPAYCGVLRHFAVYCGILRGGGRGGGEFGGAGGIRPIAACCGLLLRFWPGGVGGCGGSYRPGPGRLIWLIEAIAAYCGLLRWGGTYRPGPSTCSRGGAGGGAGSEPHPRAARLRERESG